MPEQTNEVSCEEYEALFAGFRVLAGEDDKPKFKYSHAFDLAFEVESNNDGDSVTAEELWAGLEARIKSLKEENPDHILGACDAPYDTTEY